MALGCPSYCRKKGGVNDYYLSHISIASHPFVTSAVLDYFSEGVKALFLEEIEMAWATIMCCFTPAFDELIIESKTTSSIQAKLDIRISSIEVFRRFSIRLDEYAREFDGFSAKLAVFAIYQKAIDWITAESWMKFAETFLRSEKV
jgi:hypothetical protein